MSVTFYFSKSLHPNMYALPLQQENRFRCVSLRPGNISAGLSSQLGPPNHVSSHFLKFLFLFFLQLKSIYLYFFEMFDVKELPGLFFIIISIWFVKTMRENMQHNSNPETSSDPEAFSESGSETRMSSISLLWTPSLKYCSKLKGE